VVVVIAVVYGLGAILKAKTNKPAGKEEKEGLLGRKPGSRLREIAERFQKELSELSRERMYQPPQRAEGLQKESFQQARRPAGPAAPGPRPYRPGVQQPREEVAAAPRAVEKFAPETEQPSGFVPIEPLGGQLGAIPAEMAEAEHLPEILSDYDDPEELRRAILHYEILGRPLSLRDPSGRIIGL
ncbi:MAG: hypothetical protein ACYS9C_05030, partial [Planctomycetota bacterium]